MSAGEPAWWSERVLWGSQGPRYEPAPPVNKNPWYDTFTPSLFDERTPHDGTFVYLIESGDAYKIGVSKNVPDRLSMLNCGSAQRAELVALRRGSFSLERRLHQKLRAYRLNGEWFRACPAVYEAFYTEPERDDDTAAVA